MAKPTFWQIDNDMLADAQNICGWDLPTVDPYQMMASSQRLAAHGLPIEEYPQTSDRLTAASQQLYELIEGRSLVAYPSEALRLAISRCIAVETARGWRITKEKQSHKIDVVIALAMACHAAVQG